MVLGKNIRNSTVPLNEIFRGLLEFFFVVYTFSIYNMHFH